MIDPKVATTVFLLLTAFRAATATAFGDGPDPAPNVAPARVDGRVSEASLTTIMLTPDAVRRLALATAVVTEESLARHRLFAATVEVAPGREVSIVAPIAGVVVRAVEAGARVEAGAVVATVRLGVDAEGRMLAAADRVALQRSLADLETARVDAESALAIAEAKASAAEVELSRAEKLVGEKAGSARAVDEARANAATAAAEREGARSRAASLAAAIAALSAAKPFDLELRAAFAGEIAESSAPGGSFVGAGGAIARLVGIDRLIVRVPVPNGAIGGLDRSRALCARGSDRAAAWIEVSPCAAPSSARGRGATVESTFDIDAAAFAPPLAPGERIVAALSEPAEPSLVVPHSAVLRDAAGGEWVYVETGERVYSRQRVFVRDILAGRAVLASGPAPGSRVVTAGAAELFGTEFGVGK